MQNLLRQMLEFNPNNRLKASQLIRNNIFDPIRVKKNEERAPYKIQLDVDHYDGFSLDSFGKLNSKQTYKDICRQEIVKLAHKYRKYL